MDLEQLKQRAKIIQTLRNFFIKKNFLELDTPALSDTLIPETCLEVFKTEYIDPGSGKKHELFLVPSPEVHIKPIIAAHKVNVFQLSKCYRNVESIGRLHKSEFTMLEYYKMNANYLDSLELTEELFKVLDEEFNLADDLKPPFIRMTVSEAFEKYCGFSLFESNRQITIKELADQARKLGIYEPKGSKLEDWSWEELYNAIFVSCLEPNLPKEKCIFLMNYPREVRCLAKDADCFTKERWELYGRGIELANCYSEETDAVLVKKYFEIEGSDKNKSAIVKHPIDSEYWKNFSETEGHSFPKCSGTAMGVDRLIMLLCNKKDINSI